MKFLSFLFVGLMALSASAANESGSKCGLTDSKNDSWVEAKSLRISDWSLSRVKDLPTLTKQQLIIAAKYFAKESGNSVTINSAVEAVNFLREASEANDLYVSYYNVKNKKVTEVVHFPGGNPYGVIFKTGTRSVVAYNQDDSIACR